MRVCMYACMWLVVPVPSTHASLVQLWSNLALWRRPAPKPVTSADARPWCADARPETGDGPKPSRSQEQELSYLVGYRCPHVPSRRMLSQHCFQGPEFVGHILFPAHVLAVPAHRTICSVRYIASQVHRTVKTLCPLWKAAHCKLEQKHKENAMLKLEPNTGNRTNHRIVFSAGCCLLLTVLKE